MSYAIQEVLKKYRTLEVLANQPLAEAMRRTFDKLTRWEQEEMLFMSRGKDEGAGQFFLIPGADCVMEYVVGQSETDVVSALYPRGGKPLTNIRELADARIEVISAIEGSKKARPNSLQIRDPARAGRATYLYELTFAQLVDLCAAMMRPEARVGNPAIEAPTTAIEL